ncbi:MAG: response regulator RpfG family c-di-GMP phosphodiesterase [Gammaproteobacteria bacterium]
MIVESAHILFVDDERSVLNALKRLLRPTGHKIHIAESGSGGLELLKEHPIDLVISDMRMPEMDGAQFLSKVAADWPQTSRMLLTGYSDLTSAIGAINEGSIARYLTKPWHDNDIVLCINQAIETQQLHREKTRLEELAAQQNDKLRELNESLEEKVLERTKKIEIARQKLLRACDVLQASYVETIGVFSRLIQSRTGLESRTTVADDARTVGKSMGLSEGDSDALYNAALLCDIGKLSLPDESVLTPYTQLNANAQRDYHRHPVIAEATLLSLEPLADVAVIIRDHCERHDGTGFPQKLSGEQISLSARILAVAKAYADLQTGHIFEERCTTEAARDFLVEQKNRRFDPAVVDVFVAWLESKVRASREQTEQRLETKELRSGMTLSRDLCDGNGMMILAKGQLLSAGLVEKLTRILPSVDESLLIYVKGK